MDGAAYLAHAIESFRGIRRRADRALLQVGDDAWFRRIDSESNSLALLVKHVAGNLRSRWTDFLSTDGEKSDRRRDSEFEDDAADTRDALLARWDDGWATLLATLASLTAADLDRVVTIRGEPHSVFAAIERQKEHYAYHGGQIVFLAKHLAGPSWGSLSIPRGASASFEASVRAAAKRPTS